LVRTIGYADLAPSWLADAFGPYAFPSNFDALAIGCMAALLLRYWPNVCRRLATQYRHLWWAAAVVLVVVPHVARCFLMFGYLTVPFGNTMQMIGMAILILQSIMLPSWGLFRFLNAKVATWIGVLSYSLYIWQQLFCTHPGVFGLGEVWWMSFPGWLVTTFVVASISYYCMERPLLRFRAQLR
jgi:peptidoglycan/LPS O-acetylase OafA/YrhL